MVSVYKDLRSVMAYRDAAMAQMKLTAQVQKHTGECPLHMIS